MQRGDRLHQHLGFETALAHTGDRPVVRIERGDIGMSEHADSSARPVATLIEISSSTGRSARRAHEQAAALVEVDQRIAVAALMHVGRRSPRALPTRR